LHENATAKACFGNGAFSFLDSFLLQSFPMNTARPLIREAVYLHEIAQLSDADIARATGVARSTARAWLGHTRSPTGDRAERLIELSALVERLTRLMEPTYVSVWLRKPVPALGDEKPIDLIARGDYLRVASVISALEEAPFS
jgi:uncharacterized protein (DUF2384 family)